MPNDTPSFQPPCPILRSFDDEKAGEFYCSFLGFRLVWEHRFAPDLPRHAEVERAGLCLHLSGHHGDACPGSTVFVRMTGIRAFQAELLAKNYGFARPAIEALPWGLVMEIADPFGNRLRFCEEEVAG